MTQPVTRSKAPVIAVLTALAVCVVGFLFLWGSSGGPLPGGSGYRLSFRTDDVKNLQPAGDVRIAGVLVGRVTSQEVDGETAVVHLELDREVAPLHEGATARIGLKSVIGQSFVELRDGDGAELADGSVLEGAAVVPAVEIDEVMNTFDARTKRSLRGALTGLGPATRGTGSSVDQLLRGAGMIGREGYTAVDAIEAQNKDLEALVDESTTILAALNTRRTHLSSLVRNAQQLTRVTATQSDDVEATVRGLPGLVDSAGRATAQLDGLATDLEPVARDLETAAPGLSRALEDLPSVTGDLRALLPHMDSSLGRAPATLDQVPALAGGVSGVAPDLELLLADANPMLAYLSPYGTDIGSFFGNFGASFDAPIENGVRPVRLAPIFSEYSVRNNPLQLTTLNPLHWNNPYPAPLKAGSPAPYRGRYPHVERED